MGHLPITRVCQAIQLEVPPSSETTASTLSASSVSIACRNSIHLNTDLAAIRASMARVVLTPTRREPVVLWVRLSSKDPEVPKLAANTNRCKNALTSRRNKTEAVTISVTTNRPRPWVLSSQTNRISVQGAIMMVRVTRTMTMMTTTPRMMPSSLITKTRAFPENHLCSTNKSQRLPLVKQQKANNCVNSSNRRSGQVAVLRRRLKAAGLSPELPCSSSNSSTSSKRGTIKVCQLSKRMARHTQELKMKTWQDSRGEHPEQLLIRIAHLRFIIMTETEPSVRMSLLPLTSSPST